MDYQIWVMESDTYTRVTQIETMKSLRYSMRLNEIGSLTLRVDADYAKVPDLAQQKRIVVYRDGVERFSGIIQRSRYRAGQEAPGDEEWEVRAQDALSYLKWRIIPCVGVNTERRTGTADDVMKEFVRYHAGSLAGIGRPFTDLVVAPDTSAAMSYPAEARNVRLLTLLQQIATGTGVWFRMVPTSASGVQTFTTAYPLWGLDRSQGNGVNPEMVLSFDRRNFEEIEYGDDRLEVCNVVYVGGQGEGAARLIRTRTDVASIATNLRREEFMDDRNSSLAATLDAHGDAYLVVNAPTVWLTGTPNEDMWPDWYDLGDKCSIVVERGTYTLRKDVIVTGITVEVTESGEEKVSPEMMEVA